MGGGAGNVDVSAVLDGVVVGILVHDPQGTTIYANAAAGRLLGTEPEKLLGRTPRDWSVIGEDGRPVAADDLPVMRALRDGETVRDVLLSTTRADGERVWLLVTAGPSGTGEARRVIVSFMELTGLRARYDAVVRAMGEGVVIHDPTGAIRFANAGAERILGLRREQLLGLEAVDPRWRLVRPDGSPFPAEDIPSEVTGRTGRACRNVIAGVDRGDGARAWLSISSNCIAGDGDPSQGVVATFTDITAMRESQLAEERALAVVRAVTQAVPGVIFQYVAEDGGGASFAFAAGRTRDYFALAEADLVDDAKRLWSAVHPDDAARVAQALRSKDDQVLDDELRRTEGERTRWLRLCATPERIPSGKRWTGFILDVTHQHELADGLRRAQRREAMADLAAGLAHNFNNMLAVVLPNLEAARERSPQAEAQLGDAIAATLRASELVRQILAVARGSAPADRARKPIDLARVVHEVVALCRPTFDPSIRIETELASEEAFVLGTEGQVQQVLLNLCLNARDALAGRPDPRIVIRLTPGTTHTLTVTDNGAGMTEETRQRLGELFFTTKPPGRGTGLGLATVFGTMRELEGAVTVESSPGVGTTFELSFRASGERPPRPGPRLR